MLARLISVVLILPVMVTALASCARTEEAATVAVTLDDFSIAARPSVTAGSVELRVRNAGGAVHQMNVFRTDLEPGDIPRQAGRVIVEGVPGIDFLGRTASLASGDLERLDVDLSPGRHLLLCSIPRHFEQGMWTVVRVK